jgi:hypothetical protein
MVQARSDIEQLGGLLDRLVDQGGESCESYNAWHDNVVRAPVFDGVPPEWGGVYGTYVWAVEYTIEKCNTITYICSGHGGVVNPLDYGVARMGINDALNGLIPAVETAQAMVEQ